MKASVATGCFRKIAIPCQVKLLKYFHDLSSMVWPFFRNEPKPVATLVSQGPSIYNRKGVTASKHKLLL
jgi:hypothetical protein